MNREAKDKKTTLRRLLSYLSDSKMLLTLVILASIISTFASLYGAYAISPIIKIITSSLKGTLTADEALAKISYRLIILVVIFALEIGMTIFSSRKMVLISQQAVRKMREDMYDQMMKMEMKYHDQSTHGDLMSRFTNDLELVSEGLNSTASSLVINFLTLVGTMILMLLLSPQLALISLVILPLLFLIARVIVKKSRYYVRQELETMGDLNAFLEESMEGHVVLQVYGDYYYQQFDELNESFRIKSTLSQIASMLVFPLIGNLNRLNYALIGVVGGYLSIMKGLSVGDLGAFVNLTRTQAKPVNQISNQWTIVQGALASAERIFEFLDWEHESQEGIDLDRVEGYVEFDHVSFSYIPGEPVIDDISFQARPGDKVALVGETGAGKTTIINLLSRFYDIDRGKILIDGYNIDEIHRLNVREHLGMVLQDSYLFTGTILENIRYGRLDASDEECIQAAKQVGADYFIRQLENGYDTKIEASAENLSEGEKQLLNIARVALADPNMLILDEATSSIDTRTERYVEKGMDFIMEGRTSFVIAHRLSTIIHADLILVMDQGKIIERGNHASLLAQNGHYANLYRKQMIVE